jgi:hypothetical protein
MNLPQFSSSADERMLMGHLGVKKQTERDTIATQKPEEPSLL